MIFHYVCDTVTSVLNFCDLFDELHVNTMTFLHVCVFVFGVHLNECMYVGVFVCEWMIIMCACVLDDYIIEKELLFLKKEYK